MTGKISSVMSEGEPACACAVQRGRMLGWAPNDSFSLVHAQTWCCLHA
jgi:hypothetical protein